MEVLDGDAVEIVVSVAGVEGVATSPLAALVAARTLMSDALCARVHGYLSASFYVEGRLVGSADGATLAALCRARGLDAF